jgi:hypothetical protein
MTHRRRIWFLAQAALLCGCTSAVSTLQTPDTLPPGHVQVGLGATVNATRTRAGRSFDGLADLHARCEDGPCVLTAAERRQYTEAALAAVASSPGTTGEVAARVGLPGGFDAGVRWSVTALHADVKYGIQHGAFRVALSLGGSHSMPWPAPGRSTFEFLELLEIRRFSRRALEVPILAGWAPSDRFQAWGGAKVVATRFAFDGSIAGQPIDPTVVPRSGWVTQVGGLAGLAFGCAPVWIIVEASVMRMEVPGPSDENDGWVVVPAFGIQVRP